MTYRRLYHPGVNDCHTAAMQAKYLVFDAQTAATGLRLPPTAAEYGSSALLFLRVKDINERIARELLGARNALEEVDRLMSTLIAEDNEHCSCSGFPRGLPHLVHCPLAAPDAPAVDDDPQVAALRAKDAR